MELYGFWRAVSRRCSVDAAGRGLDDESGATLQWLWRECGTRHVGRGGADRGVACIWRVTQVKEPISHQARRSLLEQAWRDVRFGVRQLRRAPGFTATAILTLALGIGGVTSVYSVVDTVLAEADCFP